MNNSLSNWLTGFNLALCIIHTITCHFLYVYNDQVQHCASEERLKGVVFRTVLNTFAFRHGQATTVGTSSFPLVWPDQLFLSVVSWPNTPSSWENQSVRQRCYCGSYIWQCSVKYCKICSKLAEVLPLLVVFDSSCKGSLAILIFGIMVVLLPSRWCLIYLDSLI